MTAKVEVRSCPKQAEYTARIQKALGVDVNPVQCHIVNEQGMQGALGKAGWGRNEMDGVVGFQHGQNVFIRDDSLWTTLHELIHRAGVNADRMNRFVAEGLVENIAAELRTSRDEHQPTYPDETGWVRDVLLPKLKMTPSELGRSLAAASDPPKWLAERLVSVDPSLDVRKLTDELKPQRPNRPQIQGSGQVAPQGKCTRCTERGMKPGSLARWVRRLPRALLGSGVGSSCGCAGGSANAARPFDGTVGVGVLFVAAGVWLVASNTNSG